MSNGLLHATPEQASSMLQLFNFVFPLSIATQGFLLDHLYPMKLGKGKILHKSGSICDKIYFVNKGAIRGFIKEGKKDSTTWITIENEMVAAIYSFIKQVPSIENMQTIEDCDLLAMRHKDLHTMFELYPESNILARRIYEKYYADAEVRALTARLSNA